MNLDDSIRDKNVTNGSLEDVSQLAQAIKFAFRRGKNWDPLAMGAKESLEQIASGIARILSGDPNHAEHWNSIAMNARVIGRALEEHNKQAQIDRAKHAAGIKLMAPTEDEHIHEIDGQSDP